MRRMHNKMEVPARGKVKNFTLSVEDCEWLRKQAFEQRREEVDLVREAIKLLRQKTEAGERRRAARRTMRAKLPTIPTQADQPPLKLVLPVI